MDTLKSLSVNGNYFGLEDWLFYGGPQDFISGHDPAINVIDYLDQPCPYTPCSYIKDTHFLFFVPSQPDSPLTLNSLCFLLTADDYLYFYSKKDGWYSQYDFARQPIAAGWHLLYRGVLPGSMGMTYKRQKRLFRGNGYISPLASVVVLMLILSFKKTKQIISQDHWGRTADLIGEMRARVGIFDRGAICISSRWNGRGYIDTGVFAEKILF